MRIGALALMLIVLFTSCRNEASEASGDSVASSAGSSAGAEAGDLDSLQQPASTQEHVTAGPSEPPANEPEGSQDDRERSGQRDAAEPTEESTDATPATAKQGEAQAAGELGEYPLQDNPLSGCTLCHVDVEDELVGTLHFEEKVGCITCHGPSEGHLADENNEVKPDEMFARADVDRLCERCHECFRPKPQKPELTAEGQRKVCTDCHGPHDCALAADAGPRSSL